VDLGFSECGNENLVPESGPSAGQRPICIKLTQKWWPEKQLRTKNPPETCHAGSKAFQEDSPNAIP
jgi:hypothetical protein